VNLLIDELTAAGVVAARRFYEAPFVDVASEGPDVLFWLRTSTESSTPSKGSNVAPRRGSRPSRHFDAAAYVARY